MDDLDQAFDDVVIFELPAFDYMEAFRGRFRPRFEGWSHADAQVWLFTAHLDAPADLASLLREAQVLVAELGLPAIRFLLDGRVYVLEAATSRGSADLAARSK